MGIFGSKKPKEKQYSIQAAYYSSHPEIKGYKSLKLVFSGSGVDVVAKKKTVKHFGWENIIAFEYGEDVDEQINKRVTATRMATLGVFSLAAPKSEGRFSADIKSVLRTTSGDIVLELKRQNINTAGMAGSMEKFAIAKQMQAAGEIRRMVAENTI